MHMYINDPKLYKYPIHRLYICHHNVDNHAFTQTQTLTEVEIRRTDGSLHTYHTLSGCGLLYYITAVCY